MTPTKEQQAQEYAEKQLTDICLMLDYEENKQIGYFHTYDIQKAYSDGYTACEQSMWRSVEEIPEEYRTLIVAYLRYDGSIKYAYVAYYQNGVLYDEYDEYKTYESFSCWMYLPTPSLPKTQSK